MEIKQIIVTTTLMHGLIIHTIRTEATVVVVEQGGGVRTLQKSVKQISISQMQLQPGSWKFVNM